MTTTHRLFVYGTLLPGQRRWPALAPFAESVAPAVCRGALWDTGLGFPAATFGESTGEIPGAVVKLRPDLCTKAIAALDKIESEGLLYRRVEIDTSEGRAESYEWLGDVSRFAPLPHGWCTTFDAS